MLDWVRDEEHLAGGDDPLAGFAFPRIWTKGKDANAEQMRIAAAAILAQTKETAGDGLAILESARAAAKSEEEKLNLGLALLSAYRNLDDYEKLHALAVKLAKQHPESKRVFFDDEVALRGLRRFSDADALAQEMAKRLPDDADVQRAFVYTAVAHEDYATAHDLGLKMIAAGKAEPSDLNSVAWNALLVATADYKRVKKPGKSVLLPGTSYRLAQNRLATMGAANTKASR